MPTTYSGNPANDPSSITIPSDGDGPGIHAADVNAAFEGLMDKVTHEAATRASAITTEATARASADTAEASARAAADLVLTDLLLMTPPGLRLTLVSGDPVPSSDQSGNNLYYTPYTHGGIVLYDGTQWRAYKTAEITISTSALLTNKIYDVFAYYTGSAVALEVSAAWASNSARTDALARQDGILVKSADHTRRFVGTFYTSTTFGTIFDGSTTNKNCRGLWNQYNRVPRSVVSNEAASTASWTYTSATWRPANNNTANCVTVLIGDTAQLDVEVCVPVSGSASNVNGLVGIGIDSTTVTSADSFGGVTDSSAGLHVSRAAYSHPQPAGLHVATWLESGGVTATFYGISTGPIAQGAITARVTM